MNNEKITVSGALTVNWYSVLAIFTMCYCISSLMSRVENLLWSLGLYFGLVVAAALITLFVYSRIFMDQVTLGADGIVQKNRLRTRTTAWDQIVQAGLMTDKDPGILVLVRSNGTKRKKNDSNTFFYLRNTGKLVAVPAEPGVAEMVNHHYGPWILTCPATNPNKGKYWNNS